MNFNIVLIAGVDLTTGAEVAIKFTLPGRRAVALEHEYTCYQQLGAEGIET